MFAVNPFEDDLSTNDFFNEMKQLCDRKEKNLISLVEFKELITDLGDAATDQIRQRITRFDIASLLFSCRDVPEVIHEMAAFRIYSDDAFLPLLQQMHFHSHIPLSEECIIIIKQCVTWSVTLTKLLNNPAAILTEEEVFTIRANVFSPDPADEFVDDLLAHFIQREYDGLGNVPVQALADLRAHLQPPQAQNFPRP